MEILLVNRVKRLQSGNDAYVMLRRASAEEYSYPFFHS
jgi:hypothetical protein